MGNIQYAYWFTGMDAHVQAATHQDEEFLPLYVRTLKEKLI